MDFLRRVLRALPRSALGRRGRPAPPERRGFDLLTANLTAKQRRQYAFHRCFDVIGGQSGKRYRLWHCFQQNVEELDARGPRKRIWCFHPRETLVLGDVLLAQKTALELFEANAISIAYGYSNFGANGGPGSRRAREDYERTVRNPWPARITDAVRWSNRAIQMRTARVFSMSAGDLYRAARLCAVAAAMICWLSTGGY